MEFLTTILFVLYVFGNVLGTTILYAIIIRRIQTTRQSLERSQREHDRQFFKIGGNDSVEALNATIQNESRMTGLMQSFSLGHSSLKISSTGKVTDIEVALMRKFCMLTMVSFMCGAPEGVWMLYEVITGTKAPEQFGAFATSFGVLQPFFDCKYAFVLLGVAQC